MYLAKITVTLRKSILDPQGKAVRHALESLELNGVNEVRIGKFIELRLDVPDKKTAEQIANEACKKLLANPVMEDFNYTIEELK